ncbi:MAG TPA: DUF4112 domain-containing protein [Burkholderiales bacterium]
MPRDRLTRREGDDAPPLEGELLGPETGQERAARERLNFLAWLLDSSIPLPGTRFTIGLDALIGLVPLLGDVLGVALSSLIVAEANRLGAPRSLLNAWLDHPHRAARGSRLFLALLVLAVAGFAGLCLALGYWLARG